MNELLGLRIKTLRTAKSLTQEQIAEQLGMSRQRYARIEKGMNNISLEILANIARIFDVTVGDITKVLEETPATIYRASTKNDSSEKIFEMLELFYANKHLYDKLQHDNTF